MDGRSSRRQKRQSSDSDGSFQSSTGDVVWEAIMPDDDSALRNLAAGLRQVGLGMQRNIEQLTFLLQLANEMLARLEAHVRE